MSFIILKESVLEDNNLFNADAEAFVCTINTAGAMGKGIAKYVKLNYKPVFQEYRERYFAGNLWFNDVWLAKYPDTKVIMYPTKHHWRQAADHWGICKNAVLLKRCCESNGIKSVAIPALGMANGWITGMNSIYRIVASLSVEFKKSDIKATLYLPDDIYNALRAYKPAPN